MAYFMDTSFPVEEGFKRYSGVLDVFEKLKPSNASTTIENVTFKTKGTSMARLIIRRKPMYDDFETNANPLGISPISYFGVGYGGSTRSFRTNAISHNQSTWSTMTVFVPVPSQLRFKYFVSSESNYDQFHVRINGSNVLSSGNYEAWRDAVFNLPVGTNTIQFGYSKDGSVNRGYDAGLVDNLEIIPTGTASLGSTYEVNLTGTKATIDNLTVRDIQSNLNTALTNDMFFVVDVRGLNPVVGSTVTISGIPPAYLTAVDIENPTGESLIYHKDEVFSVEDLDYGKRIRCRYVASANSVGKFSMLGREDYRGGYYTDFISKIEVPTAPNGNFYFIMFGRHDETGQPLLMADRIIQQGISYNTLKNAKLTVNRGVPDRTMGERKVLIAVPSGHDTVIQQTDADGNITVPEKKSYWHRMVEYANTLDYSQLPDGYNQVWNDRNIFTITRDLLPTNANQYYARKFSTSSSQALATANTTLGFRPLLEVSAYNKLLILNDGFYKTIDRNPFTNELVWRNVGRNEPTVQDFSNHGIYDFTVLNRVNVNMVEDMAHRPDLKNNTFNEKAKLFTKRIDLDVFRDIKKFEVE